MTDYTTADFSPIFGPDEKPVRKGWYFTSQWAGHLTLLREGKHHYLPVPVLFEFWDGYEWRSSPDGFKLLTQQRYWFGLHKKP